MPFVGLPRRHLAARQDEESSKLGHIAEKRGSVFLLNGESGTECRAFALGTVFVDSPGRSGPLSQGRSIRAGIAGSRIRTSFPDQFLPLGRCVGERLASLPDLSFVRCSKSASAESR
jgi:hypothetical protein